MKVGTNRMYGHAPELTALKSLPTKADEWNDLLQPYRDRYADIPEIAKATYPRQMLLALYALCNAFLKGDARPGTREECVENYTACADDYHELLRAVKPALAAA